MLVNILLGVIIVLISFVISVCLVLIIRVKDLFTAIGDNAETIWNKLTEEDQIVDDFEPISANGTMEEANPFLDPETGLNSYQYYKQQNMKGDK